MGGVAHALHHANARCIGVLTLLSRAMGWPSHTMIGISTSPFWTFFVLVLLASCIAASLYDTLSTSSARGGAARRHHRRAVPRNTDFWLNYFIPLLGPLRFRPLLLLVVGGILRLCRCCCAVVVGGGTAPGGRAAALLPTLVQKLMFEYLYRARRGRLGRRDVPSIAPIVAVVGIVLALRLRRVGAQHAVGARAPQGAGFDAGVYPSPAPSRSRCTRARLAARPRRRPRAQPQPLPMPASSR